MKRFITILLLILVFTLLTACNTNNNQNSLSPDFTVEGLSLENVEDDGRNQYYSKINSLISDIDNHSLYPMDIYTETIDELSNYYTEGVSKEDYALEDTKSILYSNYSYNIASMIQDIPYIQQGIGPAFYEEEEIAYFGSVFTTYANDDYVYYDSENEQEENVNFEILVEDSNIKMAYLYESDNRIIYQQNDFDLGYLHVWVIQFSNDEFSFGYELFNYQTDQYESIEYTSYRNNFRVILGDYANGEILEYNKNNDGESYETTILTNGYSDIRVRKQNVDGETSYKLNYNVMNITGWDFFSHNQLYLDNTEVLSQFDSSINIDLNYIYISQELINLTDENYKVIGDSTYNGTVTFEEIQSSMTMVESIKDNYTINFTDNDEVDSVMFESNTYSLEELRVIFESFIQD